MRRALAVSSPSGGLMHRSHVVAALSALALGFGAVLFGQQPPAAPPAPTGQAQAGGRRGGRANQVQIQPGQECPPGTTEIRPQTCQAPEYPPPTIVDYRPHSTLITAEHKVPKAKFPAIEYHGHPLQLLNSNEGLATLIKAMDEVNVRVML